MFNVLSYLFKNYQSFELCMDNDEILDRLSAAGFNDNDISAAIDWLEDLDENENNQTSFFQYSRPDCIRILTPQEQELLDEPSKQFLWSLWHNKTINHQEFEWVLTQLQSTGRQALGLDELKIVVLMLLWRHGRLQHASMLKSLLTDDHDALIIH